MKTDMEGSSGMFLHMLIGLSANSLFMKSTYRPSHWITPHGILGLRFGSSINVTLVYN